MRIQRSRRGRVVMTPGSVYKHFVLIPKRLAEGAGIRGGSVMHVSQPAGPGRTAIMHREPGPGRTAVTVTEQVTKRVGGEQYTSLKFVIPAEFVRALSLEPGDDIDMSAAPGIGLAVHFGRSPADRRRA